MDIEQTTTADGEVFRIAQPPGLLAVTFTLLPLVVVAVIAAIVFSRTVPLTLVAMLAAVLASSIALAMSSARLLGPVTVTLSKNGLECKRFMETKRFEWRDIAELKLVAASGSFADDTSEKMQQIGIGVFLTGSQTTGDSEAEPDHLIVSAPSSQVVTLQSFLTSLLQYKLRATAGPVATGPRRMGPAQKPVSEFRKRPRLPSTAA